MPERKQHPSRANPPGPHAMAHVVLERFELVAPYADDGVLRRWVARNLEPESGEHPLVSITGLPAGVAGSDRIRQLATYETNLAKQLDHPGICRTFQAGMDGERLFVATELPAGETWAAIWEKALMFDERVPVALAVRLCAEAADILHHAHTQRGLDGITLHAVHGAIAPSRLILRPDGKVRMFDFGVGKVLQKINELTDGAGSETAQAYRAPEQVQGKTVGTSTDVFSLGAVLWELLSMQRLYPEELERRDIVIVTEPPEPPSEYNAAVTGTLDQVVLTALAKQPGDRFTSAEDFADALRPFLDAMPLHGTVGGYMQEQFIDTVAQWEELAEALEAGDLRGALVAVKGTLL